MSEIKLNLLDSHTLLIATVHGSVGDALVAALSAEPETIDELEDALKRFQKCDSIPASSLHRHARGPIDTQPWDAGILVIDLAARIIACESTYSLPTPHGKVDYHNGCHSTSFPLAYVLSDEWYFAPTIGNYQHHSDRRMKARGETPRLDTRSILYGKPLLEFIVENVQLLDTTAKRKRGDHREAVVDIHRRWLMTQRGDLNGQSVREVLFAKRDLIDFDLQSRMLQWSFFLEEPHSLSKESHGYRFAGYGTHEWVVYYKLVRHLIWEAVELKLELAKHAKHLMSSPCCRAKSVIALTNQLSTSEALTPFPTTIFAIKRSQCPTRFSLSSLPKAHFFPNAGLTSVANSVPNSESVSRSTSPPDPSTNLDHHQKEYPVPSDRTRPRVPTDSQLDPREDNCHETTEADSQAVLSEPTSPDAEGSKEWLKEFEKSWLPQPSPARIIRNNAVQSFNNKSAPTNVELIDYLTELQSHWLSTPNRDLDNYIPAEIIDNERRRRPEAMTGRSMVVDEDCYCCKMMGDESEAGREICFCFFDGCNMEDEFAFSACATLEEWKEEQLSFEQRTARSEQERERKRVESSDTFMDFDDSDLPF